MFDVILDILIVEKQVIFFRQRISEQQPVKHYKWIRWQTNTGKSYSFFQRNLKTKWNNKRVDRDVKVFFVGKTLKIWLLSCKLNLNRFILYCLNFSNNTTTLFRNFQIQKWNCSHKHLNKGICLWGRWIQIWHQNSIT